MNFIKKNMEHIINFFKYLWERIICIILLLLFIGIITYLFFSNSTIQNPETVESQEILFCGISLENMTTKIYILLGCLGVAILFAIFFAANAYSKSKRLEKKEQRCR